MRGVASALRCTVRRCPCAATAFHSPKHPSAAPHACSWVWYNEGQPLSMTTSLEIVLEGGASGATVTARVGSLYSQLLAGVQFGGAGGDAGAAAEAA